MQPPPSIEELRLERPDLTDEQLHRREQRLRLVGHLHMLGRWPDDAQAPPITLMPRGPMRSASSRPQQTELESPPPIPTLLDAPLTLEQMADATVSMMSLAADARETMPVESAGLLRTAARGLGMVQRSLLQEALKLELTPGDLL
jgi:hypothetical protein